MTVPALAGTDLSIVRRAGLGARRALESVADPDPGDDDEIATVSSPTPHRCSRPRASGTGRGSIWFVSSYALGPEAEDPEDVTRRRARRSDLALRPDADQQIELVALFPAGGPFDGPDNITAAPHGFALACTDGEDDQWLVGITERRRASSRSRFNRLTTPSSPGATFSPDGRTLFVNMQEPGHTFAIDGPWRSEGNGH